MSSTKQRDSVGHASPRSRAASVVKPFLRGFGQVDFQQNTLTGSIILVALFVAGWEIGLFAALGTATATATAYLLGVDRGSIHLGLQGYSGALTGIALVASLGTHPSTVVLTVLGGIACTIIGAALAVGLKPWNLPPLTAPFCIVSGIMVVGAPSFERIWHGGSPDALPTVTEGSTALSLSDLGQAFFSSIGQIFLVDQWYVGLIMLVGLAVASLWVALYAAIGSVVGIATAWALGAPAEIVADGIYGYNAVLVAIALGVTFLARGRWSAAYAVFGAIAATALTATLTSFFAPFGGHTFTWPFILTTWLFLAAIPAFPPLRPKT